MDPNLVCLMVGFALGFAVREALSRRRRARVCREGTPNTDHEFLKAEASEDERRHYINRYCVSFQS
jgi:hypothetical protein